MCLNFPAVFCHHKAFSFFFFSSGAWVKQAAGSCLFWDGCIKKQDRILKTWQEGGCGSTYVGVCVFWTGWQTDNQWGQCLWKMLKYVSMFFVTFFVLNTSTLYEVCWQMNPGYIGGSKLPLLQAAFKQFLGIYSSGEFKRRIINNNCDNLLII